MTEASKTEAATAGIAPHIEELHEFFRSRGVAFGKPEDLKPFVERLQKDESFRDEMSSMVRAIIYRQRDGLLPTELLGLIVTAVAGTPAEDASEQDRDSVRQMLGFVGGVFRSRWNPGAPEAVAEDKADTEAGGVAASAPVDASSRPMTPIFYQAQVVANGGEEPEGVKELSPALETAPAEDAKAEGEPLAAKKTKAARKLESDRKPEAMLPLRGTSEDDDGPVLKLAGYASQPEPVVAFLRGEGKSKSPTMSSEPERRQRSGWGWVAAILAVIVSFGAGMYARQWMFTRYGAAWPWHLRTPVVQGPAMASPGTVQPANSTAPNNGPAAGRANGRRPAQVEAARSEWNGGAESASDLGAPSSPPAANKAVAAGTGARKVDHGAGAGSAASPSGAATSQPMTGVSKPSTEADTSVADSGEARATAMLGASPALMDSHLVFAPAPMYPTTPRGARIEGKVVVVALVGRDGTVVKAEAISGNRSLRAAAEQEVSGRRYRPYVVNDIPMAVRTLVTVDFPPR